MSISKLYFRGHDTDEFPGVSVASCDYGDTELKCADEDIAGRDGAVTSHANGRHYKARNITVVFNVRATPTTVESTLAALKSWLSGGVGTLTDDYNTGWQLTNADFVSSHTDYLDMFRGFGQLTVKMTANPYWSKVGEVNERVLKFADVLGSSDTATIAVTTSGYTVTKHDGTTATGSLPTGARKYRLAAYSENDPTVTLGQTTLTPEVVFDLPDSGTITIAGGGYGYFELWRDTRTGVRL